MEIKHTRFSIPPISDMVLKFKSRTEFQRTIRSYLYKNKVTYRHIIDTDGFITWMAWSSDRIIGYYRIGNDGEIGSWMNYNWETD